MPSRLPQVYFRCTHEQKAALEAAIEKSGLTKNEFFRRLLAAHIEGFERKPSVPRRGTYTRKK